MRRDMELVRLVMLDAEDEESVDLSEYSEKQIGYHRWLVIDAGLANGSVMTGVGQQSQSAIIDDLTWAGHDFLDNARNDTVWRKAMQTVAEKGGSVSFAILQSLLITIAKQVFGIP